MKPKLILISLALLFFVRISFGQEAIEIPINSLNGEWNTFYEDNNIQLSSKVSTCLDPAGGPTINRLLIKVRNKVEKNLLVNWHYDLFNLNGCSTCTDTDDEYLFRVILKSNQTITPECGNYKIMDKDSGNEETLGIYLNYANKSNNSDIIQVKLSDLSTNILE